MTSRLFDRFGLRVALGCAVLLATVPTASAGPVFDPFLEGFQVGIHADPEEIPFAAGYPMGLLEPIRVDRDWIEAALEVVNSGPPSAESAHLALRLLARFDSASATGSLRSLDRKIRFLAYGGDEEASRMEAGFLDTEILGFEVFRNLRAGRVGEAASIALLLAERPHGDGWTPRDSFVWELRARLLERMSGNSGESFDGELWSTMLDLAPYDRGNAWALWVAHRRQGEQVVLPPEIATAAGERFLAGLRRPWFEAQDLYDSYFERDAQAALGATLFADDELRMHLKRFPDPPAEIGRQGYWVKGSRFARRGQADAYEELARRTDLLPGWKMDVLRRASELHFLAGRNEAGRGNLQRALEIAERREGTLPLRRRLRQWSEQALVLALAREDTLLAESIYAQAHASFFQEEAEAFASETDYWLTVLRGEAAEAGSGPAPKFRAKRHVESGASELLVPADGDRRSDFGMACERSLWKLWAEWGLGLARVKNISTARREAAAVYEATVLSGLDEAENDIRKMERTALSCLELRFPDVGSRERLLEAALDRDIARTDGWRGPSGSSIVPDLLQRARSSQLDMHALLGFCLAAGDLRGILGLATELPARGISAEQKLRFLYPLPADGPVREAIVAQDSEPALVLAIARNESLFEPTVRSRAGALGFMQIMPFHYDGRGALPGDRNWACPEVSIAKAARILAGDRRRYDGDPYLTVASYNAGPKAASRWLEQLGGVPGRDIYLAWIGYPETRRYVEKVLMDREIYDWIIRTDFDGQTTR